MRGFLTLLLFVLGILCAKGQTSEFEVTGPACINERIELTNNSSSSTFYSWDFCEGDLELSGEVFNSVQSLPSSAKVSFKIVKDQSDFFGFVSMFPSDELILISYGSDLQTVLNVTNLGNLGNLLDGPYEIDFFNENGVWYGLLANFVTSELLRLTFGNGLGLAPTLIDPVSINPTNALSSPRGVKIIEENGSIYALIGNNSNNRTVLLDFGSSILNGADAEIITLPEASLGTDLIFFNGVWHGYVVTDSNIQHLIFSGGLSAPATIHELSVDVDITSGTYIRIHYDAGNYYAFVGDRQGDIFRVNLGSNLDLNSGAVANLGNYSVFSDIFLFDMLKDESSYHLFVGDIAGTSMRRILFDLACPVNQLTSELFEPHSVEYLSSDSYSIGLGVNNDDDRVDWTSNVISITGSQAPDINFLSENCIAFPTRFEALTMSTDINLYTWDFGDGNFQTGSDLSIVTNQYGSVNTYSVNLEVDSNNGCSNRMTRSIEIFNQPIPDFSFPVGLLCSSQEISFTNTSTFDPGSPISYLWDFNDEGTSTDANPTFTFQFGGMKDVTLTTSIPGCSDQITKQVDVEFGAVPDFSFQDICLGEVATFTDLSNGAGTTITDWNWDFGDGNISTLQNPTNPYAATGDYNVSLTVTNDLGCAVTDIQTISVHANPVASFANDPACEGPVQFTDQTTVESANITQWLWDFDNGDTSTEKDPIANFSQSTEFEVNLIATSNFGCSDEITQTISVQSAPTPEFTIDQACLGEPVQFNDQTNIESINPVTSYFWEIEDEVYSVMNPEHTFSSVGTFTARMTLTVANGCVVVSEQQVVVPAEPTPEFSNTNPCVNSVTTFEDQSLDEGDPIVSRTWDFDGLATANGPMTQFVFTEPGNYNISLTTTSTLGCTAFIGKTITVNEQPMAAFNASATLGPPPLSVNFTNQSEEATSFSWLLNDDVDPFSFEEHAALLFEEEGDFAVSLIAFNGFGCTDTLTQIIEVVFPATDLALDEVIAVPNNGKTNIVLRGANRGTLAIDGFDIVINIEDDITLIEEFNQTLLKSQPFVHTLNFDLQGEESNVEFICIDLQLREVEEPNRDNNQQCINFEQEVIIQEPFPNPTSENLRVNVLIPEVSDGVQVTLMNIYGEIIIDEMIDEPLEGLNIFDFNVNALTSGLYVVRIRYDGVEEVRRVRKE